MLGIKQLVFGKQGKSREKKEKMKFLNKCVKIKRKTVEVSGVGCILTPTYEVGGLNTS